MGFFDQLKSILSSTAEQKVRQGVSQGVNQAANAAVNKAASAAQNKKYTFTFPAMPNTLAELKALPEAELKTPCQTAALTVLALCAFAKDQAAGTEMLNFLRGPKGPMVPMDINFLKDRFMDGAGYIPRSFFAGSTPDNDYTPSQPLTVTVSTNPYSFDNQGYVVAYLTSGGADSPRPLTLREKPSEGKWYLWEQNLLAGIRVPKSQNAWA